ncbi:MAG: hypothetical protein LC103_05145, partial [Anaerolineales bacterium]|nr:hypothetical protein [Anaerolineales bacterium]
LETVLCIEAGESRRLFQESSDFTVATVEQRAAQTNGGNAEKTQPTRRVRLRQVPPSSPVNKPKSPAVHTGQAQGL